MKAGRVKAGRARRGGLALLAALAGSVGGVSADAQEPAPQVRGAGRGVVIVALGSGTETAAKALAREVYGDAELRPSIDEVTAQVLCGSPAPDGAPLEVAELATLRGSLDPDPAHPATRRALESVAAQLGATGILAVHRGEGVGPRAMLVRVGSGGAPAVELVGGGTPTEPAWPSATASLRALLGNSPARSPSAPDRPVANPAPASPRQATTPAASAGSSPIAPTLPAEEPPQFWERPWFWIALGAFAAAGVTALVVSQTGGDEESGDTVRFRATIPQATVSF